jgi:hypothetical protein
MEKQKSIDVLKMSRIKKAEKVSIEFQREYLEMDTDEEEFGHQGTVFNHLNSYL